MAYIVASTTGFPEQYYSQEVLATALRKFCMAMDLDFDLNQIDRFFTNVMIQGRYFALPLDAFYDMPGPGKTVSATIKTAVNLTAGNIQKLLEKTKLDPKEIAQMTSVTLTAAVPSIDARVMNHVPLSPHLKRFPLFGFGCLGGAAGVARVAEYLKGHPKDAAILFSVELASALWQGSIQMDLKQMIDALPQDPSVYSDIISTIVTAALFGDGSAAVLMVGDEHPLAQPGLPRVLGSCASWQPNTIDLMGMDIVDTGFRNILRPHLADYIKSGMRMALDPLLESHNISVSKISRWIVHPGGPKVLDAVEEELGLDSQALQLSRETLKKVGNLSSATVLCMLNETLEGEQPPSGSYGLLMAMGPGFSQELILLQW
ncbi:MAG: 3-oxoacyl-[acyl-carrier-protein] synthase III C-terminal domain-containing protein [Scytonema sp. PMC 1069.18]|nr:3-oxoacyl-[acyl-carrier-protein] synthase III C-terminal domain-containing protein [Scytonema sp. PMC 1069.18]MEC4882110.1 3-oxoacyl-[acyl-carrier-protein] synthase III C-terminal domain-containing protein [Scytonema sp. PMC 1070.18]